MSLSQPPVISQHWRLIKRDPLVIQRRRSGYAGPVTVVPNTTWIRQFEQTGLCSSDQVDEVLNAEQDSTQTVTNLDAMNLGTQGACWKVSAECEALPNSPQTSGSWPTKLHHYKIVWQQVTYAQPVFA